MNDLRNPIGIFFALVGLLLLEQWREVAPLTTAPVNLYVGVTMILFGLVMVWLARKRS
jgi:prolipoprotein diacylglyceryltransferase